MECSLTHSGRRLKVFYQFRNRWFQVVGLLQEHKWEKWEPELANRQNRKDRADKLLDLQVGCNDKWVLKTLEYSTKHRLCSTNWSLGGVSSSSKAAWPMHLASLDSSVVFNWREPFQLGILEVTVFMMDFYCIVFNDEEMNG